MTKKSKKPIRKAGGATVVSMANQRVKKTERELAGFITEIVKQKRNKIKLEKLGVAAKAKKKKRNKDKAQKKSSKSSKLPKVSKRSRVSKKKKPNPFKLVTTAKRSGSSKVANIKKLPDGFLYVNDPRIILSMNYATEDNFIGRQIISYNAKVCILTAKAYQALLAVQDTLDTYKRGYRLRILDAYRPTSAVADFKQWSLDPKDHKMKSTYYPHLDKPDLFQLKYISEHSAHSRGSTVDLTITIPSSNRIGYVDLDMGTIMDFFGEESHTNSKKISETAQKNRALLVKVMGEQGFKNYEKEWWHFTLKNEPFPNTYFDFPVQ